MEEPQVRVAPTRQMIRVGPSLVSPQEARRLCPGNGRSWRAPVGLPWIEDGCVRLCSLGKGAGIPTWPALPYEGHVLTGVYNCPVGSWGSSALTCIPAGGTHSTPTVPRHWALARFPLTGRRAQYQDSPTPRGPVGNTQRSHRRAPGCTVPAWPPPL